MVKLATMDERDADKAPARAEALPPPGAGEELANSEVKSDKERSQIGMDRTPYKHFLDTHPILFYVSRNILRMKLTRC